MYRLPRLTTNNKMIDMAYRMAMGDIVSNICEFQDGMLKEPKPVMLAGIGYNTPWTRDAAINVWNCGGVLFPDVSKNTLLSVVIEENGVKRIGGEYWDAIIWAVGAKWYYKYNGDEEFYKFSAEVIENSLKYFEDTEFNEELNLFRGAACYGDGIAAYPDFYVCNSSGIKGVVANRPEICYPKGVGVPLHTLSTNCLYYEAYKIAFEMTGKEIYKKKADAMKTAINKHFWNEETGLYDYIVDDFGGCTHSEGMGQSFAILFGVADEEKAASIVKNQPISPNGIACVYPGFPRYEEYGVARHSMSIWPHIQAFWADAAASYDVKKFEYELLALARNSVKMGFFAEIYHPESGEMFGGWQECDEGDHGIVLWKSEIRQMWSATGYIRMIMFNLLGMRFEEDGIYIKPNKIDEVDEISFKGLKYRNAEIDIKVKNFGKEVFVPADTVGKIEILI